VLPAEYVAAPIRTSRQYSPKLQAIPVKKQFLFALVAFPAKKVDINTKNSVRVGLETDEQQQLLAHRQNPCGWLSCGTRRFGAIVTGAPSRAFGGGESFGQWRDSFCADALYGHIDGRQSAPVYPDDRERYLLKKPMGVD
jgi:hypothetical protein